MHCSSSQHGFSPPGLRNAQQEWSSSADEELVAPWHWGGLPQTHPGAKPRVVWRWSFYSPLPASTLSTCGHRSPVRAGIGEEEEACPLFTSEPPQGCTMAVSSQPGGRVTENSRLTPCVTPEWRQAGLQWQGLPLFCVPLSTARKDTTWRSLRRLKPHALSDTEGAPHTPC